jgi:hypothetical protein
MDSLFENWADFVVSPIHNLPPAHARHTHTHVGTRPTCCTRTHAASPTHVCAALTSRLPAQRTIALCTFLVGMSMITSAYIYIMYIEWVGDMYIDTDTPSTGHHHPHLRRGGLDAHVEREAPPAPLP